MVITVADVLVILYFQQKGFRMLEVIVAGLIGMIFMCFGYEILVSDPDFGLVARVLLPKPRIITRSGHIIHCNRHSGATVMPHNLYLHSSIVQTRNFDKNQAGRKEAIRYATIDSGRSPCFCLFCECRYPGCGCRCLS